MIGRNGMTVNGLRPAAVFAGAAECLVAMRYQYSVAWVASCLAVAD